MSKIIRSETLVQSVRAAGSAVAAVPPSGSMGKGTGGSLLTAKRIEEIQQRAYDESYAQGYKEGLAAGQKETKAAAEHLQRSLATLSAPFAELDEQVEQELVALAVAIARQVIRREIKMDPGQVVAVVREAIASLPVASRNIRVFLNPDDAALVREALSLTEGERAWQILEEPTMTRGGCRVVTDTSQIDANLESRLTSIVTRLMGGERINDQ